ncbi:hypothetical protein B1H10_02025 [candidate division KSB1 bacterium 4484_188]|nr:MAG: hypothetical protein B1H10_02025 [candidate division KSB1 bacterium 4484_188]HFE63209.1 hypothetical protein [Caldithrix sp.]
MSQLSKGQKRLLVVLLIIAAYAVFDVAKNWDTYMGFYSGKGKKEILVKKPVKEKLNARKQTNSVRVYEKGWKADPFFVTVQQKKTKRRKRSRTSLILKAISYAGDNSVAMINNRIVSVGDVVGGFKVLKINQQNVILGNGVVSKVLSLK